MILMGISLYLDKSMLRNCLRQSSSLTRSTTATWHCNINSSMRVQRSTLSSEWQWWETWIVTHCWGYTVTNQKPIKHRINRHKTMANVSISVHLSFHIFLFPLSLINRSDQTVLLNYYHTLLTQIIIIPR